MKRSFTLTIFVWVLVLVLGTFQAVANGANPRLFEGAPQINPPSIIGNYPSTPFLFYIPTLGDLFTSYMRKFLHHLTIKDFFERKSLRP